MTEQFSSHILYAVSYSVIGEDHIDYYANFTNANDDFQIFQRELTGSKYHQCDFNDVVLYRAQIEIPKNIVILDEKSLLTYVSSPNFVGNISKTRLDFLYHQSQADRFSVVGMSCN